MTDTLVKPAPPATQPTTSSTSPTTPDATTVEVEAFLQARVAGSGAEAFLAEDTEPQLMYATSTGAPYQWFDLVELTGLHFNPLTQRYWLGGNVDVNYFACCRRPEAG